MASIQTRNRLPSPATSFDSIRPATSNSILLSRVKSVLSIISAISWTPVGNLCRKGGKDGANCYKGLQVIAGKWLRLDENRGRPLAATAGNGTSARCAKPLHNLHTIALGALSGAIRAALFCGISCESCVGYAAAWTAATHLARAGKGFSTSPSYSRIISPLKPPALRVFMRSASLRLPVPTTTSSG